MSLLVRTITLVGVVASGIVSLAGYTHPAVNPTEQHLPRVVMPPEPVHTTPKSDRLALFDKRWDQMPTVAEIRTIPLTRPEPPPLPVVRPEGKDPEPEAEPEPKHRRKVEREPRHQDVCERHGLHKVITRGGRSWRCRR
jgi:hypothetical protein